MFFHASQILGAVLMPSNFLIAIGVVGLILSSSRYQSLGRKLLVICVAGFVLCGFLPVGNFLLIPLETRFPAWDPGNGAPDGIIVLGGGLDRIFAAARLAHEYPAARVVYSGGSLQLTGINEVIEADVARPMFIGLGLARDRVLLDSEARNTLENARASKSIAAPKPGERWVLVTSAYHMPRAIGIFREAGFAVEPYPVGGQTRNWAEFFGLNSSFLGRVAQTDLGVREWLGLIANRLSGRTSALLPSPEP